MKSSRSVVRKRELLARGLQWSGVPLLLSRLPARDTLLVLTYHRIGNPEDDLFDSSVFSATGDELDRQICYLKRYMPLVTLDEALAFANGAIKEKTSRCRVLITFDDGYLDNYKIAFPILRSHGVQGVFFLTTNMVGSSDLPWWDRVARLVKTARSPRFSLSYPSQLTVDIAKRGVAESVQAVMRLYKSPANSDPARLIRELAEASMGEEPKQSARRFLSWDEAREMSQSGMAFGSHTHSHQMLGRLEADKQREELFTSRAILKEQLGIEAVALAYPVGSRMSFTDQTQSIARELGYRCAFSHYGGINPHGAASPFDIKRNKVIGQSWTRFLTQAAVCRVSGSFWP